MAKLRHLALSVEDVEKTAAFYKAVFQLEETKREGTRIWLSDGVVSLAILDANKHGNAAAGPLGLNHFGFSTEDLDQVSELIVSNGGTHHDKIAGENQGAARQIKFKDLNGIYLEVVNEAHTEEKWYLRAAEPVK